MTTSKPVILMTKEKHGTYYYDISTMELRNKTFYVLLKERMEQGWYGEDKDPRDNPEFEESLTSLKNLLAGDDFPEELRVMAERKVAAKESRLKEYLRHTEWYERVKKVLSLPEEEGIKYRLKNGPANEAETLLWSHCDYEYEGFDIIRVESV
ncbi:MAG: hypothetical protein H9W81_01125 [Enterococcus sp.]|nr:hypothetical protein [Enterococcus sp.]